MLAISLMNQRDKEFENPELRVNKVRPPLNEDWDEVACKLMGVQTIWRSSSLSARELSTIVIHVVSQHN